jgi:hypothetical protein
MPTRRFQRIRPDIYLDLKLVFRVSQTLNFSAFPVMIVMVPSQSMPNLAPANTLVDFHSVLLGIEREHSYASQGE